VQGLGRRTGRPDHRGDGGNREPQEDRSRHTPAS
jgi:hypothetical protein